MHPGRGRVAFSRVWSQPRKNQENIDRQWVNPVTLSARRIPMLPAKRLALLAISLSWSVSSPLSAEQKATPPAPEKTIAIRAGHLIDGRSEKRLDNVVILIKGDTIVSVTPNAAPPTGAEVLDLSKATVLPGFIDTHTHVLLNGDITAEDYDKQLLKDSIPYRAILGARNARIALENGFTAIRDLETEGAMYADVDVKKAIANGEVPGRACKSPRAP